MLMTLDSFIDLAFQYRRYFKFMNTAENVSFNKPNFPFTESK